MQNIRVRGLLLVMVVAALFVMAAGAAAQEEMPTFGLSEEDFALWTAANGASMEYASMAYSFTSNLLVDVEGDAVSATINGDGYITAGGFQMNARGEIQGLGAFAIEVRAVGDAAYITGIDETGTWYAISESDLQGFQDLANEQLPFDAEALASGDTEAMGLSEEAEMEVFGAVFGLMESVPTYLEITREADEDGAAVFYSEFLLSDLVQDEDLETLVAAGISSEGEVEFAAAQEQASEAMGMATMVLAGSELSFTQHVDAAAGLVDKGVLVIAAGGEGMPFTVDFSFDVVIDEYDVDYTVEAPAESTPLSELTGALMGGM